MTEPARFFKKLGVVCLSYKTLPPCEMSLILECVGLVFVSFCLCAVVPAVLKAAVQ